MDTTASVVTENKRDKKRIFYDIVFIAGFLFSLIPGPMPSLSSIASLLLIGCIAISFFDENFYLYTAIFIYLRYRLLLGDTPAFRLYSYLVVLKFLFDLSKTKFRAIYFPSLFVFLMHSIFATGRFENMRIGLNVIVDVVLVYVVLLKVLENDNLMRKFMIAFMLGGVASGIYGWTNDEFTKNINISGAGAQTVSRNFGALSDANFAGLFYSLCIITSITLKNLKLWIRGIFLGLFGIMLLQTASLSAILITCILSTFYVILKFRRKSILILSVVLFVAVHCFVIILVITVDDVFPPFTV